MDTRTIFFVGKPGSGKGTQAKLLSETTSWKIVSASGQLRTIAAEDTLLGKKVKAEMDAGDLVPYWFVTHLYLKALTSLQDTESVIFDGFSRKVSEAEVIVDSMQWLGRSFTILDIKISDEEVHRRLAERKEIESRVDDAVDGIADKRLQEYREHTEPSIELFRNTGNLIEINGEQTREAIAADINAALGIK